MLPHPRQIEALRMWRACALYGIPSMSLDDNYPLVCRHLAAPSPGGGSSSAAAALAREAYLAAAELVCLSAR